MVSEILGRDDKSLRRVHGRESPTSRWSDDKLLARVPSPAPGFVEGRALSGRGVRRRSRSGAPLGVLDGAPRALCTFGETFRALAPSTALRVRAGRGGRSRASS
jgi:hypothetical protein